MMIFVTLDAYYTGQIGNFVLAHCISQPLDGNPLDSEEENCYAHQDSRLFYWATKKYADPPDVLPQLFLIDVANICHNCIGVPTDISLGIKGSQYLFLKPKY